MTIEAIQRPPSGSRPAAVVVCGVGAGRHYAFEDGARRRFAARPIDATQSSGVTLFRSPGREPFTERLVHVLMRGVVWLHTTEWPEGARVDSLTELLSLTHTVTLTLLVNGYSRQEIADARGLTLNTVSTYSRDRDRQFDVRLQRELSRRFLHGEA